MTTPIDIELDCPCCSNRFESTSLMSTNTFRTKTDFHQETSGFSPLPLYIHTCKNCGYSGFTSDFGDVEISDEVKDLVRERLTPLARDEIPFPGRRYEYTAWIQQWQREPPNVVGHTYLMAAWCCDDDNMVDEEEYYRRQAIENFEAAIGEGTIPENEVASVTYLIGELYRRVGEAENAARWFDRVTGAVGGDADKEWLVIRAQKQKTDPDEFF